LAVLVSIKSGIVDRHFQAPARKPSDSHQASTGKLTQAASS
jgi:hypothetical protein